MHKRLWLFLILYLAGIAMSPVLAGESLPGKKTLLYSLEEGNLAKGQYEWQEKLPDFYSGDATIRPRPVGSYFSIPSARLEATQNNGGSHRPLYVLFHAFLFYELS